MPMKWLLRSEHVTSSLLKFCFQRSQHSYGNSLDGLCFDSFCIRFTLDDLSYTKIVVRKSEFETAGEKRFVLILRNSYITLT